MKISAVIMASGRSSRFGENKLLYKLNGKMLIENTFNSISQSCITKTVCVTRYDEVVALSEKYGFEYVKNFDLTNDLSVTIKLGVEKVKDSDGIMLCVADQPFLSKLSIDNLCFEFKKNPNSIYALSHNKETGNPVIFPKSLFGELMNLPPFSRGKKVLLCHKDMLKTVEVKDEKELFDIDTKEDL